MNSAPTPPKPAPETVAAISPPAQKRVGTYTAVVGGLAGALALLNDLAAAFPDIIRVWGPFLTPQQHALALAVAATLGIITGHLGGWRGTNAAARVAEQTGVAPKAQE